MDPSYDNGSGSNAGQAGSSGGVFSRSDNTSATPGVKPGVIASGPDPADVPSASTLLKDPPAIEIASETTPGLSLGSRHLFKKPRAGAPKRNMIASGGDSSNIVTPSVSSSRASGGGSRGSKKGLIIGGILIVLLVVGLIVGLVVMNGSRKGGNSNSSNVAFNNLINYVTSGTKSNVDVTSEYDVANDYYFLNGWDDENQKKEIYDETKKMMDDFVGVYKDGDNQILNNLVKNTKDQFDFMYVMDSEEKVYSMKAAMEIIKNGDSKGKQNLLNYYKFSGLDGNSYADEFLKVYSEWIDALIAEIKIYEDNNCISGMYIDTECVANKNDENLNTTVAEATENANSLYSDVAYYYDLSSNFVNNVYYINDLLHGKVIMGEDNEQ